MKVLFDPADGKLLGAQVLGWDGVDKRIDVLAVALRARDDGLRPRAPRARLCPALRLGEGPGQHGRLPRREPAARRHRPLVPRGLPGLRRHGDDPRHAHAGGVRRLAHPRARSSSRTPSCASGWTEVPRDKPVYTYCRSGFRSYIAYDVLKQNGWDDVAFLAGGMMTYHGFHRTPLKVGKSGMPMVTNHVEDVLAERPAARSKPDARAASTGRSASWVTRRSRSRSSVRAQHAEGPLWDADDGPAVVGRHHRTARPLLRPESGRRPLLEHRPGSRAASSSTRRASRSSRAPEGLAVLDRRTGELDLRVPIEHGQDREPRERRQGRRSGTSLGRHDGLRQAAGQRGALPGRARRGRPAWSTGSRSPTVPRSTSRGRGSTSPTPASCVVDVFDLRPRDRRH